MQGMEALNSDNKSGPEGLKPRMLTAAGQRLASFEHVFVLCTGRCGSVTFAKACEHFSNFTSGHETRVTKLGDDRTDFPSGHIEVDNRLAWFLGRLQAKYGDRAFYVHLTRDEAEVGASYDRRWHHHGSLIQAFDQGVMRHELPHEHAGGELARTINENIRSFLRDKPHQMTIDIRDIQKRFPEFIERVGAAGDLETAIAEFDNQHNATSISSREKSKQSLPIVRLTIKNRKLRQRIKRLRWLAVPGCVLFSPILVAEMLLRIAGRMFAKSGSWSRWVGRSKRAVCDAYLAYQVDGLESANDILNRHGPTGAVDLFEALHARSDEAWLPAMNRWAQASGLPKISLRPGNEERFDRWEFETPAMLESCPDKVSVIMPAFNAESTLELAATSILKQTWSNLELIIVNDCSSDKTGRIADQIAARDDRVRVLHNSSNVGPYVSKNRALLAATGRFVTGHDADDIATPNRLAEQVEPILKDPKCQATIGYMIRVDREAQFAYPSDVSNYSYDGISKKAMISLLVERDLLLSDIGFWDSVRFGGDSELLRRVSLRLGSGLCEVQKIIMVCLYAEGSLTNNQEHGVTLLEGVSPVREQYKRAWSRWHKECKNKKLYLPFPNRDREFDAPESMLVPDETVNEIANLASFEDVIEAQSTTHFSTHKARRDGKLGRIGIVCYWFNRGQAVVGRRIRSALEEAGFETFILARPTKDSFVKSSFIDRTGVWDQDGITPASQFQIPEQEYLRWAAENRLDAVLCDQNLQFPEIAALRARGIQTIGRFVWEAFGPGDVAGAKQAYDVIYSLTACEQKRYEGLGISSPLVRWGCPPELCELEHSTRTDNEVRFFYPGGYLSDRKPTSEVLEAFQQVEDPRARLILKVQHPKHGRRLARRLKRADSRIRLIVDDLPDAEHYRLMADSDVLLAPTRWEGLGLHHSEAIALGLPCITNDFPPMNEKVSDSVDGLLVPAVWNEEIASGVPRLETPVDSLRQCIERMCDDDFRRQMTSGVERRRLQMAWTETKQDFIQLILSRLERAECSA